MIIEMNTCIFYILWCDIVKESSFLRLGRDEEISIGYMRLGTRLMVKQPPVCDSVSHILNIYL